MKFGLAPHLFIILIGARPRLSPPHKRGGVAATRSLRRRRGGYLLPPRFNFVTSPSAPYKTGRSHPSSFMRRGQPGTSIHQDFEQTRSDSGATAKAARSASLSECRIRGTF